MFIPALTIPVVTVIGTFTLKYAVVHGVSLVDSRQVTLISLGVAILALRESASDDVEPHVRLHIILCTPASVSFDGPITRGALTVQSPDRSGRASG